MDNSKNGKVETPVEIWNSLVGKELTDIDIEEYVERLKVARENKKRGKRDRSAKILTADNKISVYNVDECTSEDSEGEQDSDNRGSEDSVGEQGSDNRGSGHTKKSTDKDVKVKGTNVKEDVAVKIGALVFFGIFGVVQLLLIIDWLIKGCLFDTLAMHLLPVIIVVCLFVVTSFIDLISNRVKKKGQANKEDVIKGYNRYNKNKKGGK